MKVISWILNMDFQLLINVMDIHKFFHLSINKVERCLTLHTNIS